MAVRKFLLGFVSVLVPGLTTAWLALGVSGSGQVDAAPPDPPSPPPDRLVAAEDVVEVLLDRLSTRGEGTPHSRVTMRPIVWPEEAGDACRSVPHLDPAAVGDFLRQNAGSSAILPVYVVRMPVALYDDERFGRAEDALAMIAISPAGFNSTFTEAIVYVDHLTGILEGRGYLYRLIRTRAGWRVREVIHVWVR